MLTQARLRELLSYDPNTNLFTWRAAHKGAKVGSIAGTLCSDGYRRLCIDYKKYLAHRLVWFYVYGTWPKDQIDHINGVRDDNRIDNLREANHAENQQNVTLRKNSTSGFPGVSWHKCTHKWQAYIVHNKKQITLGYFDIPEEAHAAYLKAKRELHTFQPTMRD